MRGRRRHRKKALQRMEMDLRKAPREHFYTAAGVVIPWWFALSDQQIVELVTTYLLVLGEAGALEDVLRRRPKRPPLPPIA